jgi:hypothetical protein
MKKGAKNRMMSSTTSKKNEPLIGKMLEIALNSIESCLRRNRNN